MEAVTSFSNELTSLHDCKPPISKAKMTAITKAAIKAVKFYKHVVQSVEKFIQKCRSEFKVPGLYVIDSIVRQSRHQFGADKDVFATRFAKNFNITFQNLFKCPTEEKSKIVRVLNLWQKNAVFTADVIQPLLDMANPNHIIHQQATPTSLGTPLSNSAKKDGTGWNNWTNESSDGQSDGNDAQLKSLLQALQSQQQLLPYTAMSSMFQASSQTNASESFTDNNLLLQFQQLANIINQQSDLKPAEQDNTVKFNKKLLDFDYSDEEEEEEEKKEEPAQQNTGTNLALNMAQNLLSNPDLLKQLQQMQQTLQQTEMLKNELSLQEQLTKQRIWSSEELMQSLNNTAQNQAFGLGSQTSSVPHVPYDIPQAASMQTPGMNVGLPTGGMPMATNMSLPPTFVPIPAVNVAPATNTEDFEIIEIHKNSTSENRIIDHHQYDDHSVEDMETSENESSRPPIKRRERSRSRSPSRSRKRVRRSRTRSKSPRRRSRSRSSSRSHIRHRRDRRSRSKERDRGREKEREKEREKAKERNKRGLPPLKRDCLGVCSTTLWLGHVSKLVSEEDLADTFGEFGDIVAIDLIPPRGCAFVCMNRRQDAYRALTQLKNFKLHGKTIMMAWAPGKGVKGKDYKDYWDAELGVSYIPFEKIPDDFDLEALEDGGMLDDDSMSEKLKNMQKAKDAINKMKKDGETDGIGDKTDDKDAVSNGINRDGTAASALPVNIPQMSQFGLTGMVPGQTLPIMPMNVSSSSMMMASTVGQTSVLGHPVAAVPANLSMMGSVVGTSYGLPNSVAPVMLAGHANSVLGKDKLTKDVSLAKDLQGTHEVKDGTAADSLAASMENADAEATAIKNDMTSSIPLPPESVLAAFDGTSADNKLNPLTADSKGLDPTSASLSMGAAMTSLTNPLSATAAFPSMTFPAAGMIPMPGVSQGFQNPMDFSIQNPFQAPPPYNPMMPPPMFQPCFPIMPMGQAADSSNDSNKFGQWRNFPAAGGQQRNNFSDSDSKVSEAGRNSVGSMDKLSRDAGANKMSPRSLPVPFSGGGGNGPNRIRPPGPLNDNRSERGNSNDVNDSAAHNRMNHGSSNDHPGLLEAPVLGGRPSGRFNQPSRFGDFNDGEPFRPPRPDSNHDSLFSPDIRMRPLFRPGVPGQPRSMMNRFPLPRPGGPAGFGRFPQPGIPHRGPLDRPGFHGMSPMGRGGFPLPMRPPIRGPHPMERNRMELGREGLLNDRHFMGQPNFDYDREQDFNRFEERERRDDNFRRDFNDWHHDHQSRNDRRESWKEADGDYDRDRGHDGPRESYRDRRSGDHRGESRVSQNEWGRGRESRGGRDERNSRWERDTRDRDRERDRDGERSRDRSRDKDEKEREDSRRDKSRRSESDKIKTADDEAVSENVESSAIENHASPDIDTAASNAVEQVTETTEQDPVREDDAKESEIVS